MAKRKDSDIYSEIRKLSRKMVSEAVKNKWGEKAKLRHFDLFANRELSQSISNGRAVLKIGDYTYILQPDDSVPEGELRIYFREDR